MTVKVGDQVLYGKYSGTEIEIDGEKLMIMKESDIYAII
jgi:chaperonin GroES